MNYRIIFSDGTVFPQPETPSTVVSPLKSAGREWMRICVTGVADEVKIAFVDNAQYAQTWDSVIETVAEDGTVETSTEVLTRDLSAYSIAGEVVDHRDGTCTVLMGKPTEMEAVQAQLAAQAEILAVLTGEEN